MNIFKHIFISTILFICSTFCCTFFVHAQKQENSGTFPQIITEDTDGCYYNNHHDTNQKITPSKNNKYISDETNDVGLSSYPTTTNKILMTDNSGFYERQIFDKHSYFFTDTIRLTL